MREHAGLSWRVLTGTIIGLAISGLALSLIGAWPRHDTAYVTLLIIGVIAWVLGYYYFVDDP